MLTLRMINMILYLDLFGLSVVGKSEPKNILPNGGGEKHGDDLPCFNP